MHAKHFNAQSATQRITQGITKSFLDSVSCCKYPNVNNCVVCRLLAKKDCFLKSERYFSKKPSSEPRKRYELSLWIVIRPSRLFAEAEFGWKIC